jgi:hypothetical protein
MCSMTVLLLLYNHPAVNRYLSWDDYFMALAHLSAERSKDPNKQVGPLYSTPSGPASVASVQQLQQCMQLWRPCVVMKHNAHSALQPDFSQQWCTCNSATRADVGCLWQIDHTVERAHHVADRIKGVCCVCCCR